jgi:hypothetical protein
MDASLPEPEIKISICGVLNRWTDGASEKARLSAWAYCGERTSKIGPGIDSLKSVPYKRWNYGFS